MLTKELLKKEFARDWKKHYQVKLFKERGFLRKTCPNCGKNFWALDSEREVCGDPPCQDYEFIGNPIPKRKLDYIETWKVFEKFFVKNGHKSIKRYPVVDRWRPDLFFTMCSIQDFQRIDNGNMVFEYPEDPLIVPQVCLRFPDIPNIGVTGRHNSCFIMSGQHSFGNYWKDKCIELNFNFLTKEMGIPEKELVYIEDIWAMPDFSAFGPNLEVFSKGLELVNNVFMQFTKTNSGYKELPIKVVDVGWGHERLVWFSQGTLTSYDAIYGPVIKWMKKQTGLKPSDLFVEYSKFAGKLDFAEVRNLKKAKEEIAKNLGVNLKILENEIEPLQALYAMADHTKALLFAITDGGIPSNVAGGYNLRVLLRRAFSFIKEYNWNFNLQKIAELHAKHLKPLFPELKEGLDPFSKIIEIEKERYEKTLKKSGILIERVLEKKEINTENLIKLYTSHGITPELIEKVAKTKNKEIKIPEDFYLKLTQTHEKKTEKEKKKIDFDISGLPRTNLLFYEEPNQEIFKAKVLRMIKDGDYFWVVLDKTLFYPEGGGQPEDKGFLNGFEVLDVQKIGEVVFHKIKGKIKEEFVEGKINLERRKILMQMHTATHILGGAAREILGRHVWQAGSQLGLEKSRLDITHYKNITLEEIEKIEELANEIIKKNLKVEIQFLPRSEAEKRYGFIIYQGGASPGKEIRIVKIQDKKIFDVEACGGLHVSFTGNVLGLKIIKTERIQDGVVRIEFTAGEPAFNFVEKQGELYDDVLKTIFKFLEPIKEDLKQLKKAEDVSKDLRESSNLLSVKPEQLQKTIERFAKETEEENKKLNELRKESNLPEKGLEELIKENIKEIKNLKDACEIIFNSWKNQKKEIEKLRKDLAKEKAEKLIGKARKGKIFEIVHATREDLIEIGKQIISKRPDLTIILANEAGDIIGMSKTQEITQIIKEICEKCGGSGGGKPDFAQGKLELSKLLKFIDEFKEK